MQNNTSARPLRRVGTFTLGVVLVVCGSLMTVSLFFPELDLRWALQASPLILVLLGVETLLAARKEFSIKYDWMGMFLCFLLVCSALCLYAAAWAMLHFPQWYPF